MLRIQDEQYHWELLVSIYHEILRTLKILANKTILYLNSTEPKLEDDVKPILQFLIKQSFTIN